MLASHDYILLSLSLFKPALKSMRFYNLCTFHSNDKDIAYLRRLSQFVFVVFSPFKDLGNAMST